ncbi:MAG TPA: hypothetical protein VL306_00460 [Methylomirabilota bacterium]|jgi:hypothetical protein|nr:hypothetical protein [Methylomirabilota bacterium]
MKYRDLSVAIVQDRVLAIINGSESKEQIRDRIVEDLGYPYPDTLAIQFLRRGEARVMMIGPKGPTLRITGKKPEHASQGGAQ